MVMDTPTIAAQRANMMLAHLVGLLFGVLGALIYWMVNKDRSDTPCVQDQAREVLNFELNVLVLMLLSAVLIQVGIGLILVPLVWTAALVLSIVGAVSAYHYHGKLFRYPFIIRLIK